MIVGFEIRPLHLDRDLFAGVQTGPINLPERCGGDRLELKFGVNLVDLSPELVLDSRECNLVIGNGGTLSAASPSSIDERQRQKVGRVPIDWPILMNVGPSSISFSFSQTACFS